MARYVSYRDFDWLLLAFVLLICALGVMEIHSATVHTKFAGSQVKQIYWIIAGVGMMFLPVDARERLICEGIVEHAAREQGLAVLGWRDTPVNANAIGRQARATQPYIEQVFLAGDPSWTIDQI